MSSAVLSRVAATGLLVVLSVASIDGRERSAEMLFQGYELAYNLDHEEAVEVLTQAIDMYPTDPAPYRGLAAITWLRILFLRNAILVDSYMTGSVAQRTRKPALPPAELDQLFHTHAERAIALSEEAVRRSPEDPSGYYELGASIGLAASYTASIEGEPLEALRDVKRAITAHEKVLELDPTRKDANLTLGIYRYVVSLLPRPLRMVAYLAGFDGGKMEAIRLIEEAASYPGEAQMEAKFALVLLYNREKAYDEAQRVLQDLKRRYPRNRLVWLESASTWLRDDQPERAERALEVGFAKLSADPRTRMAGEEPLWRLKRGETRVALGRPEARSDLIAARDAQVGPWITGHALVALGKLADLEGDRDRARPLYDEGRKLCGKAKDKRCEREAKALKQHGFSINRSSEHRANGERSHVR